MQIPTHHYLTLTTIALSTFITLPASGQTINEDLKLTASDATAGDEFGRPVAISGTTAIVGTYRDNDAGNLAGSAYLFDTTTGEQLFKLTASDAEASGFFGWSAAISGTTAIVGAQRQSADDSVPGSGSVYVFDTTTGEQLFKLNASDADVEDRFGWSVAISGTTAIAGAFGNDDAGIDSGAAYIFDTTTGEQLFKLTASDAKAGDRFGRSVGISGTTAIIGAIDDAGFGSGSAYIFNTTTGEQLFKLTASDAGAGGYFGWSVAISGTIAIVGASADDDMGTNAGAAYIFDTTTGEQLLKLTASDAEAEDRLGWSVAISGTTAIAGAFGNDDAGTYSGSAYIFDTTTGEQLYKLTASDATAEDYFGGSVAISGTTAIVGADWDDDAGTNSGSAYLFNTATPCTADLTGDGELNFFDVSIFLTFFQLNDPVADFNGDGEFNFFDVSAFLNAFAAGCP